MTREVRDLAEALREEIEALLLEGTSEREVIGPALKAAEAGVSKFCELGPTDDGIGAIDSMRDALASALAALTVDDDTEAAREALVEARMWADNLRRRVLDDIAKAAVPPVAGAADVARPLSASVGSPALHEPGEVPPPEVLADERPWDEPPDVHALLAEDAPGPEAPAEVPPVRTQIERLGRDAMEDIAILGGLRRLRDEERWTDGRGFEERLLANLDALWSLDRPFHAEAPRLSVPRALWSYVTEWSFPDWGRAFALSFAMGCARSTTALRWVILAMRKSDPAVLEAYIEGLSLASNPGIDRTVLSELAGDTSAELTAAWLAVAERRRLFDPASVLPLLGHPSPAVRASAARCLRHAPRGTCVAALGDLLDDADPLVAHTAADELAARGEARGIVALREALARAPRGEGAAEPVIALRALALAADPKDEALLVESALAFPLGPIWLGWYGRPAHLEILLHELEAARGIGPGGHARAKACERAIERITGTSAEAAVPALRQAHAADAPVYKLGRARRGRPHDLKGVVAELSDRSAMQGDRRVLVREVAGLVPDAPRLDVEGWISQQEAALAALTA
jgi:hypothetical protein